MAALNRGGFFLREGLKRHPFAAGYVTWEKRFLNFSAMASDVSEGRKRYSGKPDGAANLQGTQRLVRRHAHNKKNPTKSEAFNNLGNFIPLRSF